MNPGFRLFQRRGRDWVLALVLVVCCILGTEDRLSAHEVRPAIATLQVDRDGQVSLVLTLNAEALIAGIGGEVKDTSQSSKSASYDRLRAEGADVIVASLREFWPQLRDGIGLVIDGRPVALSLGKVRVPPVGDLSLLRISSLELSGQVSPPAKTFAWRYSAAFGDSVMRVRDGSGGEIIFSEYVKAGSAIAPTAFHPEEAQSGLSVFLNYIVTGYRHIIPEGTDHILFVVGLFLLSSRLRDLLVQVTSFTVAHSVSLALAMLGIIRISPSIVEPLIAASIIYVAVENLMTSRLQTWRPAVVFGFGLLHGLGFAGVLTEIGLSPGYFIVGLVGFNLGVELGQLTVIAACFLAVGFWFRSRAWYRNGITVPASLAIAAIAAYWFVERVAQG